jgi:hypothetical protein
MSDGQSILLSGFHLEPMIKRLLSASQLQVSWIGAPALTRGWVCTIASGPCQSSHSLVQVPQNSDRTVLSHMKFPQPGDPGPHTSISQEQGGPVTPLGTGFHFHRLLRFAGLRWRYSNPPPLTIQVGVKFRPTISRPVCLGVEIPSGAHEQIFLSHNFGFLELGRPPWREDGSVISSFNCFWALP